MRRVSLAVAVLVAQAALAQVSTVGDIVVIQDPTGAITNLVTSMTPTSIIPSQQEQFCRAAYNAMRTVLPDQYDGIISFSTSEDITDLNNVWQGSPVRSAGSGYGRQNSPWVNTYNGQKISQCVFMGTLGRTAAFFPGLPRTEPLPPNPDSPWMPSIGVPIPIPSLTGIEMLGHEYGHHWLMGIEFDQNDGRGRQHFIRGYLASGDPMTQGSPNQHYSHFADSRSVMYGECITDLGNGTFELRGCPRKYSHIDQYLMGLRAASEVSPMMVLEDAAMSGQGVDTVAMAANSSGSTVSNMIRHDITADEIIRAMGARIPAYPMAQNCWRVAFVVVLAPGQTTIPPAMLQKVEAYRARWGPWFSFATDGRGTMDSRINGNGCVVNPPTDGGVVVVPDAGQPDAGQPDAGRPDAGDPEEDAGIIEPDAGEQPDAGGEIIPEDAGAQGRDAGPSKWDTYVPNDTGKIRPGCGCGATGGFEVMALLGLLGAVLRRARHRDR
ncbi:MAG: hypothetical protein AB1938_26145 [Myxococcota bacterium]